MSVSERIRRVRDKTGLGQKDFAERVGVSKNTQLRYENGQSHPALDYLERVAAEYGVEINWLMTGYHASDGERLNIARYQVLGGLVAELGLSNEQVGLLIDWAYEGKPEWVAMARSMVSNSVLASLSPQEQSLVKAYRKADEDGKKTLEMTAQLASARGR